MPSLKRIVPEEYTPEDLPHIARYIEITGPRGPLLQTVPAYSPAADAAQHRLLDKLRANRELIQKRFDRRQAPDPDKCWIHKAKFCQSLLEFLIRHNIAWHSHDANAYGNRTWYALHPTLGSAVMTTLGLSIAAEQSYDVVTRSTHFHEMLLVQHEDSILDALLTEEHAPAIGTSQATYDLAYFFAFLLFAQYAFIRFDTAFLAAADILRRRRLRLSVPVAGFFWPRMLAAPCRASMSA